MIKNKIFNILTVDFVTVYTISSPVYCCLAPTSSFEESSDDRFLASGSV